MAADDADSTSRSRPPAARRHLMGQQTDSSKSPARHGTAAALPSSPRLSNQVIRIANSPRSSCSSQTANHQTWSSPARRRVHQGFGLDESLPRQLIGPPAFSHLTMFPAPLILTAHAISRPSKGARQSRCYPGTAPSSWQGLTTAFGLVPRTMGAKS